MSTRSASPKAAFITTIKVGSVSLAGTAIVAMALVMLAEAVMRYVFTDPLGWNISAVERFFMPISVFLALPWLYVTAGHVSAEIIYDRLPATWRTIARTIGHILVVVVAAALTYGGMVTVIDSFVLGDTPPPGSSEVPIASWVWELSQPLGSGALFLVALLDSRSAIVSDSGPKDYVTDDGHDNAGGDRA